MFNITAQFINCEPNNPFCKQLNIVGTNYTEIPAEVINNPKYSMVETLNISGNMNLIDLSNNVFPPNIKELNITYNNNLQTLPNSFPDKLVKINISNTKIKILPPLPPNLRILNCPNNELESLPVQPDTLVELNCADNNIKTIPNLSTSLIKLNAANNNLRNMPPIPDSLNYLYVNNNNISHLTRIPEYFDVNDNPLDRETNRLIGDYGSESETETDLNMDSSDNEESNNAGEKNKNLIDPATGYKRAEELRTYPLFSQDNFDSENPKTFSSTSVAFDSIEGIDVPINEYLSAEEAESEGRFVICLNGECACQSLDNIKRANNYRGDMKDIVEIYECKNETPETWEGNAYIRNWLKPNGRSPMVKIFGPGGVKYIILKPSFFWDGPIPGSKVFNMVPLPDKINKYISSSILPLRENASNTEALGADHCNQLTPEIVYKLELMNEAAVGGRKYKRKTKKYKKPKKVGKKTKKNRRVKSKKSNTHRKRKTKKSNK